MKSVIGYQLLRSNWLSSDMDDGKKEALSGECNLNNSHISIVDTHSTS